ncbi:MAG: BT_3928 family protein [Chitinophagaceae bacterium]
MKILINIARIIVGVLFICSGLVKANDPLGLSYKMQEFFEVWGWDFLNAFTLSFSILMIAFEIIAGVAVLLGWRMKLFSWLLLLLIIFFTFLTGYAVLSGKIRSCGCFGDCIPLTALQSFMKDLVLTALIVFIFIFRNQVQPLFSATTSGRILLLTVVISFALQGYVFKYLPIVDCLPYKVGKNIQAQMKIPPGAIPDSSVITFVYTKQNQQVEFTSDKFPEDFDDSLYHFVRRYDKLVRAGNAEAPIKDFVLTSLSGTDTTTAILEQKGAMLFLFVKDAMNSRYEQKENEQLRQIATYAKQQNIPLYLITNAREVINEFTAATKDSVTTFMCDAVAIKTAARANPTLYLVQDGIIKNKWAFANFAKAYTQLESLK